MSMILSVCPQCGKERFVDVQGPTVFPKCQCGGETGQQASLPVIEQERPAVLQRLSFVDDDDDDFEGWEDNDDDPSEPSVTFYMRGNEVVEIKLSMGK
jgi:hypothetical protein